MLLAFNLSIFIKFDIIDTRKEDERQMTYKIFETTSKDDFKDVVTESDLKFLKLSGYKIYHRQGYYGQDIKVAVIDSGADMSHNEIKSNIRENYSYFDYTDIAIDDSGHGTHVASTICGKSCGIAPRTEVIPIKV